MVHYGDGMVELNETKEKVQMREEMVVVIGGDKKRQGRKSKEKQKKKGKKKQSSLGCLVFSSNFLASFDFIYKV